jgi:hypothetical protein
MSVDIDAENWRLYGEPISLRLSRLRVLIAAKSCLARVGQLVNHRNSSTLKTWKITARLEDPR